MSVWRRQGNQIKRNHKKKKKKKEKEFDNNQPVEYNNKKFIVWGFIIG